MNNENINRVNKYIELDERTLSNIHYKTLFENKNQIITMGYMISQSTQTTQDRSEFYEPDDITPVTDRMYQQTGIVGRPGCIMLFHPKMAKSATDLVIMVEKNQVAYTLNRDKALKLSADFIDEIDAQYWELRDLLDAVGVPRYKGSISKQGKVVLPNEVSTDSANGGVDVKVVSGGINSGNSSSYNTANKCAEKANAQREYLDILQSPQSQERTDFIQQFRYYEVEIFNAKSVSEGKQKLNEFNLNTIFENAISRGMNAANNNLMKSHGYSK